MGERKTEGVIWEDNNPLVIDVYNLALNLLKAQGILNTERTKLEFQGSSGLEVSITIGSERMELYDALARFRPEYGIDIKATICKNTDSVRVSFPGAGPQKEKSLELYKSDPGQQRVLIPDLWKLKPMMRRGVVYSMSGKTTAEELRALVSILEAEKGQAVAQETSAIDIQR